MHEYIYSITRATIPFIRAKITPLAKCGGKTVTPLAELNYSSLLKFGVKSGTGALLLKWSKMFTLPNGVKCLLYQWSKKVYSTSGVKFITLPVE